MASTNRVLSALSEEDRRRLQPHLERVHLPSGRILCESGDPFRHAWFPIDGVVSFLGTLNSGATTEVAIVGNDGMIGLPSLLPIDTSPCRVLVQIPVEAYRTRAEVFRGEFKRGGTLQDEVMKHVHYLLVQLTQSGVCNRHHDTTQRLCRWLLMYHDRVHSDTIALTHEFISQMLGAARKRVSAAAGRLQDAGLIRQRHGRIKILSRDGLQAWACECYEVVRRSAGELDPESRHQAAIHHRPART